jgi:hypothetical protein
VVSLAQLCRLTHFHRSLRRLVSSYTGGVICFARK